MGVSTYLCHMRHSKCHAVYIEQEVLPLAVPLKSFVMFFFVARDLAFVSPSHSYVWLA